VKTRKELKIEMVEQAIRDTAYGLVGQMDSAYEEFGSEVGNEILAGIMQYLEEKKDLLSSKSRVIK